MGVCVMKGAHTFARDGFPNGLYFSVRVSGNGAGKEAPPHAILTFKLAEEMGCNIQQAEKSLQPDRSVIMAAGSVEALQRRLSRFPRSLSFPAHLVKDFPSPVPSFVLLSAVLRVSLYWERMSHINFIIGKRPICCHFSIYLFIFTSSTVPCTHVHWPNTAGSTPKGTFVHI